MYRPIYGQYIQCPSRIQAKYIGNMHNADIHILHIMRGAHNMIIILTILLLPVLVILECAKRS